jgi:hypothetical protein
VLQRVMRNITNKYVKLLWTNQSECEATWELEEQMRQKYHDHFEGSVFMFCLSFH